MTKPARDSRPVQIVMFAVIACGLLVAAAFVVDVPGKASKAGAAQDLIEPSMYATKAAGDVSKLSSLDGLGTIDVDPLPNVERMADAELQAAIESALAELEAALAASTLPELPEDYVAGAEIDVRLPAEQGYGLPVLPNGPVGTSLRLPQVEGTASPVGPRQGTPLDDVIGQLGSVQQTLEGLLGSGPLEGLGGLPVGGLPVGQNPEQVQGAGDAVDPDEEGALRASAHAGAILGTAVDAYATTEQDLERLLALYESLVAQVEAALEQLEAVEAEAQAGIESTLEDRLESIEDEVAKLESQASKLAGQHRKLVGQAEAQAAGSIRRALAEQTAFVEQASDARVANLTRAIASVQAGADERKAEIEAIVQASIVDLDDGTPEAQQALQAVQASAAAATMKVDRDAKAQIAALQQQAKDVRVEAAAIKASLGMAADGALDGINGTVDVALGHGDDVRAYLLDVAAQTGEQLTERETALAADAVTALHAAADARAAEIVEAALDATTQAEDVVDGTNELVGTVEDLAMGEVDKDLDYLLKVAQDYGRVPTEDRKARSAHWSGLAGSLSGVVDDALSEGTSLERLAGEVASAALQAQGELQALA